MTETNYVIEDENINCFELSYSENVCILILINEWYIVEKQIHLSILKIQAGDTEIMTAEYGSSGSFGSKIRSKYIRNITYTGRISTLPSKPTPIHRPVQKSDLDYSN